MRLRVTDDRGLVAESRRSFFVLNDPELDGVFPAQLGVSGEASPVVADLDGDGRDEIILATADGTLRILRWESSGGREQRILLDSGLPGIGSTTRRGRRPRETLIREPAVGDLSGRGEMAIVAASREGKIYAFNARGERLEGLPGLDPPGSSRLAARRRSSRERNPFEPVLADLDGKTGPRDLVTALDGPSTPGGETASRSRDSPLRSTTRGPVARPKQSPLRRWGTSTATAAPRSSSAGTACGEGMVAAWASNT